MKRKIIQISASESDGYWTLTALCDDGTIWHRVNTVTALCNYEGIRHRVDTVTPWECLSDIPQDTEKVEPKEQERTGKARVSISPEGLNTGEGWEVVEVNIDNKEKEYDPRVINKRKMIAWLKNEVKMCRAEFYLSPSGFLAITGTAGGVKWWWDEQKLELCGKRAVDCFDVRDGKFYYGDTEIPVAWIEEVTE